VIAKISSIFPRRHIGPLMLRRIFVSLMAKLAADDPERYKEWPSLHAPFINTSPDMWTSHYNRSNMHEQAAKTGNTINTALGLVPQREAAGAIEGHLQGVRFLDSVQDPVTKVINERCVEDDLQFLCG
jgi:hypothetical protein